MLVALAALGEISNAPIYAHELEINGLAEEKASGSLSLGLHIEIPEKISVVKDGDILTLGDLSFTVLHTPGHTVGSICLYEESQGVLFSGDTLFLVQGRNDLHSGSPRQSREAYKDWLLHLIYSMVYPGHDHQRYCTEPIAQWIDMMCVPADITQIPDCYAC